MVRYILNLYVKHLLLTRQTANHDKSPEKLPEDGGFYS